MTKKILTVGIVSLLSISAISFHVWQEKHTHQWQLPSHVPRPFVPKDNPITEAKIELGRYLFYDKRLSFNHNISCGSCHRQALAFTDGLAHAVGTHGDKHPRSAMSLANTVFSSKLTWANHLLDRLENQALVPLLNEEPPEMGIARVLPETLALLNSDPVYQHLFKAAFPYTYNRMTLDHITKAIATFVRSIVSFDSAYDRYVAGDETALSANELRGMELFFSERLECFHCHGGFNFSDSFNHFGAPQGEFAFHNNGLYNLDAEGSYPEHNQGIFELTGDPKDKGRYKAPTLRNIAVTAPYMHDGSIATLNQVIDHYADGGRTLVDGPYAGDGSKNPNKSEFIKGFVINDTERADLLAFLNCLTDQNLLTNPRYADPFLPTKNSRNK